MDTTAESTEQTLARWARIDRAYAQAEAEWRATLFGTPDRWAVAAWQFGERANRRVDALLAATPFV